MALPQLLAGLLLSATPAHYRRPEEERKLPLMVTNEPKRRFVPSKWEAKMVVKMVRAIRNGWVRPKKK